MLALINKSLERARHHHLVDKLLDRQHLRAQRRRASLQLPPQRRKILFESLEPRLLMSADLLPGAVQSAQNPDAPVNVQVTPPSPTGPQINWTTPLTAGDAPLFASSLVSSFDLDNFSSPLAPVAPSGGLVYAGGVQGTLDFDGDSDTLTIALDANQSFTLRLKPPLGLQARMEAFDPNGGTLGALEAANAGDTLVLQLRTAANTGSYSIQVDSVAGAGNYTVEIFLNAALEDADSTDTLNALNLDSVFSALLDSDASRAAVIGSLSTILPARVIAEEDFQDGNAFYDDQLNGIWALDASNPDAYVARAEISGEVPAAYLDMHADQNPEFSTIEVDNGEGGTYQQEQYTYDATLNQATWRLDLAGVTQARLDFDRWGTDTNGDFALGEDFVGTANFDGVSISTDGNYWVVLQNFGPDYGGGTVHSSLDLVQAATAHGLTLGSNTRIRFQFFDAGGTFTETQDTYRNFDNIRVTTDQQQLLLTPAGVSASGTEGSEYTNSLALLTDGVVPAEFTDFNAASNVYWSGQEAGPIVTPSGGDLSPAAGELSGLYFDIDLGGTQRVTELLLSVDNNDDYAVDYSLDGSNWTRLVDVLASAGNVSYGMDTLRYTSADRPYSTDGSFTAVQAHYLRFYATGGDGAYAVGEIQAFTDADTDPADWYSLSLTEGELATFTLSLENTADNTGVHLDLYDQDQNLVTSGLPAGGQVSESIQNFRAPATGTYTVRISGSTTGDYNLVAVKQAQFGASTTTTQDLTLTPIVLDALSGTSGTSGNIRVAVLGDGNVASQLNDDTYFNFSATNVQYYNIDTVEELNNFDVVVIGASQGKSEFDLLAPVLRPWVEAGHGLVASGWSVYYAGASSGGGVNADIDAIVPVNLTGGYQYNYYPTIHITNNGHPVTLGLSDFSGSASYVEWSSAGADVGATILGTTDGNATIVVGQPGNGRSAYLGPVYPYYNWTSGMADRLLEQAVAWAGPSGNQYSVQALAGTDLTVTLDLIGNDAEQPVNDLAPVLEVYDSIGNLLASGTTVATYSVLEDASFTIRVSGAGSGDYLLRVSGDLPSVATSLQVLSSTLDGVNTVINFPNQVDITFSQPVLYTSLEPGDLQVNGNPADGFTILSPTQVRFNFANTFAGDGNYLVELLGGSVTDIHGNANQSWTHGFTIDAHGPTVVASSVSQGATLEPGVQAFTFTLSEALDASNLSAADVQLRETLSNQLVNITGFTYNGIDNTVTVTTASVGEGAYELRLLSGFLGFKDVIGNYLDGDANGIAGGDFTLGFGVDVSTLAYPAMQGLPPTGSLVYDPLVRGVIHATGDIDTYTVNLDAGQTLSVLVNSVAPGLQIEVAVLDADDNSQVALATGIAGETVALQALVGLSGNYRVEVRGLAGTGSYGFSLILNALLENEMLVGTVSNDSISTAQDIAPSSLDLGSGGSRMAVVGDRFAATNLDDDVYRIHLGAGQLASVGLAWTHNASGELLLDLLKADGSVLAIGANDAGNAQQAIRAFVAVDDADYYLRVRGSAEGRYNLVVTRGMSFSLPSTQPGATGQDISLTGQVLGAIGGASGSTGSGSGVSTGLGVNLFDASGFRWDIQRDGDIGDGTSDAYDGGMYHVNFPSFSTGTLEDGGREVVMGPASIGGVQVSRKIYVPADQSFARFLEVITNTSGATVNYTVPIRTNLGSDGSERFITTSSGDATVSVADNWLITDDSNPGTSGGDPVVTHVLAGTDGRIRPATFTRSGENVNYSYNLSLAPGQTQIVMHFASQAANQPTAVARAPVLAALGLGALNGMSSAEKSAVMNFNVGTSDFLLQVVAGDVLQISTLTPGDGAGEPANTLNPSIELVGPNGNVVASDTNSAADGRNASLSHTALVSGTYTVRVLTESGTGDFVLRATGATGVQPPLTVSSASISEGQVLNTPPGSVDINFSGALRSDTVQAGDLTVNGVAAVGVVQVDADTLRFDISGLVGPDGAYTLDIALSAVSSTGNLGVQGFSRSFFSDGTSPTVTASSVAQGDTIVSGARTLVFTLSEDLASSGLGAEDVLLSNTTTGVAYTPASFVYNATTDQVSVQYTSLPEGAYTLTLLSGANSFRDLVGNGLDGNPGNTGPDNHVLNFNVDDGTTALPAFSALVPAGSLIYRAEAAGRAIHGAADTDAFTVTLDAGQTLTLWATQTAGSSRLAIELFDAASGGTSLASSTATSLNQTVLLQTVAVTGGTYRVEVRSAEGTGQYTLKALLNAAAESEMLGGAGNDSQATAQDLSGSLITTGSDRAAVLGQLNGTAPATDWYSVHLDAGQAASAMLTPDGGVLNAELGLGLYDALGNLLTAGTDVASNVDEAIVDFVAPSAGTYYLRVTGSTGSLYDLVLTRGQSFSLELNNTVQDISQTGDVLGALGSSGSGQAIRVAVLNSGSAGGVVNQLNDDSFFNFTASSVSYTQIDTLAELASYDVVMLGDSNTPHSQLLSIAPVLRQWVEAGGGLVGTGWLIYSVGAATGTSIEDINAIVPVDTSTYYTYNYGPTVTITDGTHPVTAGVTNFATIDYVEYPSNGVDAGATVLGTANGQPAIVVSSVGSGRSAYLGPTYLGGGSGFNTGAPDRLLEQAVAWAASDTLDTYLLQVQAGDQLALRTSTPFDGSGEPAGLLDARIELLDETGTLVASDDDSAADGRNASLNYTALSSGAYTIRVRPENGSARGEYVLHATGATGASNAAPTVIATSPIDGKRLGTPPSSLTFDLSEGVLAASVGIDDLTLSGGATVTSVEVVDGDTLRFLVSVPAAEGTISYTLLGGGLLDLQGTGNLAHSGSFVIDSTGPRVVSQNPEVQSVSPFNTWTVTFSEALNPSTVQPGDFVLRNPGNSGIGISSAALSGDGLSVTLTFADQYTQGNYTLTVGTDLFDLAGNRMDQDGTTAGNQTYLGTVQVASPDLNPVTISVTLPSGAPIPEAGVPLGSQVLVTWTVRNIGTDAARSSAWYDSLWISTDTDPANDTLLGNYLVDVDPTNLFGLPAGEQYTNSALVTLPLNDSFNPVNHFIRVQADYYSGYFYYSNLQPENNENNNGLYSSAVPTVVPPLPDLVVTDVVAPVVVEAGKAITVSWTDRNTGGASAQNWYDRVVLSSDQVFGNADDVFLDEFYTNSLVAGGATLPRSATVTVPANRLGTWNVLVKSDVYNGVYERLANENNNVGISTNPLQVVVATEDLTPTTLTAPDAAVLGSTIDVAWTVQNAGTGPTYGDWLDRVVLSIDQIYGNGDDITLTEVYASSAPSVRPLASLASYNRSVENVTLPLNASLGAGTYYLLLRADANNAEPELSETNNVLARAITLSVPPVADLTVSNVDVPGAAMFSGDTVTVNFTLNNVGSAAASNFHNTLYLSSNGTSADIYVGDYVVAQTLAAGASLPVHQTITVPLYSPGNWHLLVFADAGNNVYEHTNENNNQGSSAGTLNASLPPLPDLLVSNIVAPLDALAGGNITITWTVTNQGTALSGPWSDAVYLSTNGGASDSIYLGSFAFDGTLAVGESVTRSQVFTLNPTLDGLRTVVVYTDAANEVNETHQYLGNNRAIDNSTIRVTFPPLPNLQVTALTPPNDPASGTDTIVSWVVTNTGTGATSAAYWYDHVHLSLNTVWGDGDDTDMGYVLNPNYLPIGESYQNSRTISIPKGLNGDYYFLVKTDTFNNVFEDQKEGDNVLASPLTHIALTPPPDLRVQSVEAPNIAFSGQIVQVSWTVVNDDRFASGRTLESGWYDRVIMSADDELGNGDDRAMGDFWHVGTGAGALDPGETYNVTKNITLPVGVVGDFHFFVITDAANHVYEHGFEFNNSAQDMQADGVTPELTNIALTPPPDLEVLSVTAPVNGQAGHTVNVSWSVANYGSEPTRNNYWVDRVYLSADNTLDAGDIVLGDRGHYGVLDNWVSDDQSNPFSYDASLTVTLPFGISGNYRLLVKTDAGAQVFEGLPNPADPFGENNNTTASGQMAVVNRPADLIVSSFDSPAAGESGKPVSISWTVRNNGTGDTVTSSWVDQVVVSLDGIFGDADDMVLATFAHSGLLDAGAGYASNETVTLPFSLADGNYFLYVRTDGGNQVFESDNDNNLAYRGISVDRETPDLLVTDVQHADTGTAGQSASFSWRVENLGTNQTNTGYWYDNVYLSLDQNLDAGDTLLGARLRNNTLAIGAGYDATAAFALPSGLAADDYFVIVRTDRDNGVTEGTAGELNNLRASDSTIQVLPGVYLPPDLTVITVDAPEAAISGQSMHISWTVRNDGPGAADSRSWYDAVYLSRDGVLDRDADIYLTSVYHSNLGAGDTYTQSIDVDVPYGQSGPFYLFVATDAGRFIGEGNEFNNIAQDASFTQVSLAPPADLVVGTVDLPSNTVPGRSATISFSINNEGVNPAMGSWSDSVYLSLDDTWDINDAFFGVATHSGTVDGGSSYSNSVTATLPGVTPGQYKVIVRSDIRNRIPESDETNNIGGSLDAVLLDVDALTLGVASTYTLGTGQAVYYKFDVAAGETVRLVLDSAGADVANELYVRHGSMPSRGQFDFAAREGFTSDPQLVIPTTEAGTYYVLAYGQYAPGSPSFQIKAEVIPFSVTDVDARIVSNAGDVTLRIQGAKFGANTEFSLLAPDGTTRITAHAVQVDSSSEVYATFSLFQAGLGAYHVVAEQIGTLPDGSQGVLAQQVSIATVTVRESVEEDGVYMNIAGPTDVMVNRTNLFTLNYVNDGGVDVMAPLIIFESHSATPIGLSATNMHTSPVQILAASYDGPMDILRPGARYSVPMVFQSPGVTRSLDMRSGRIMANDIRVIEDWDTIESSIRPSSIGNDEWVAFWGRIKPLIGSTWGEYVTVLNSMMLMVSEPGQPIRDVRDIFARMYAQNPDYVPYASMGGEVRDAETDLGVADIQMAAYLVHADGRLEHKATTISDADGHFAFARLVPGTYKIVAIGRALDMNRDDLMDQTAPQFVLGQTAPLDAGVIYLQHKGGIGANNDSNPLLNRDANGITHMVWTRDGHVWHAWYDLASGQWKDAQAVSTEDSYAPAVASSGQLFVDAGGQTSAGLVIAWQQGRGNNSEIWYAVARAKAAGGFEWSAPVRVTNDSTMDVAPQVVIGDNGLVMITHLKRDGEIQDDTDIYYDIFAMSEDDFSWPVPASADIAAAGGDGALTTEGVSLAYGRQWKFGPWDFFGTEAEIVLALSGQVSEADCKATLGAQGQISGSFKGSSIRSTISGNGNVAAEWSVNEAARDWQFNSAKAGWGASAQFDWRYGLSTMLSKIPHPAVTSAYLAYSFAVGLASRFGLTFEDGITFGGGASFTGMEWTLTQPFPDFVWPESIAEASLSGLIGVYAQLDAGPDSVRLQGDITVTLDIAPEVKLKSIAGNITLSGNIGWFTFNEVFSVNFYSASGLELAGTPLQTQDDSAPIFDPGSLLGSTAVYGTNHVVSDVTGDRLIDSGMSVANDAGALFGTWTHMADPNVQIGSDVMVAQFTGTQLSGSWGTPVAVAGAMGLNSDATAAVDGLGQRLVVWTHADSSSLNGAGDPTLEAYEAALDANDVVFAVYNETTGQWGAMQTVAATTGMDTGLTIGHDASGNLVTAWVRKNADASDTLMTATWNGTAWTAATEVMAGASIMDPAMEQLGTGLILVWEQDADPTPEKTELTLHYSIFSGGAWSAGAVFDPIAMATGLALSAGMPVSSIADTGLGTEGLFPGLPIPEECLKCKPEEIKRLRESAPVCRAGGGTDVTFDSKSCTEKTIVYRPCVVRPRDPNDIIGPEGFGDEEWVGAKTNMGYMIRFENAADATAPAQEVVITQQLDADLDWRTFRVDDFGFGEQIIEVDGKTAFYQKRLDFTTDPTRGYFLDVSAAVDVSTGIVTWRLTTIDPNTGDVPQNALMGFLPVNDTVYDENHDVVTQGTGRGEGYVTYTVKARRDVVSGTVIDAQALIIFDTEEPIETPAIANTLDAVAPQSQVIAFATATTNEAEFQVHWAGEDDEAGSGVRDYSVWVSVDGGAFEIWLADTEQTEGIYLGETGHTYGFFTTARDNANNEELPGNAADATITVSVLGGSGTITGSKFEDYDGDGVRDDGEAGLSGWTVFLDADQDGQFDAGEVSTVTASDGSYSFLDLSPGAYTLAEVLQTGWVQTRPGDNSHAVVVVADQTTADVDFGNFHLAQIGGQKINDLNANGMLDEGEEGLAGWTIRLDRDGNGSIDATTTTDQYGYYRFTGIGPGSYTVSELQQAGWLQTGPASGSYTVVTTSGADIGNQDFANVEAASISGTKFEDLDGDAQRDAGEAGLSGWTIFLDTNGNGGLDAGERFAITNAQGAYRFDNLLPGAYAIAEVMQAGWVQTSPGAGPSSASSSSTSLTLSGMDVVLSLPEDIVAQGSISTQAASANDLADSLVGLDAFRADSRFAGINGSGVRTVVIDTGIDLNHSWFGPDLDLNGVADRIVYSYDFADGDADASDRNGHGSHVASLVGGQDATYGGVAPGADLIALKVFGDDGSGYFSYLEAALQWVVANADTYHIGVVNLSLGDGGNWNTAIGRYGLGDELAAIAGKNILITAASGNNYFQYNGQMGVSYPAADPAVLAVGAVWSGSFGGPVNYASGAIDYSTGADLLAAFGQRDGDLLDVLAPGTRLVGANYNGGSRTMFGTSQASAYMAGIATLAQDLALDHLGRRLSMAEFSSLLASTSVSVNDGDDENDNVVNTGLDFARVDLLSLANGILLMPVSAGAGGSGSSTTDTNAEVPLAAPGVHHFDLAAGEDHGGVDFGNFALGSIGGTVFHDHNANDTQDPADGGLGGWTVFLDGDGNGQLDIGEHSTVTGAGGQFQFDDVGPGSYRVTMIGQVGWTLTTSLAIQIAMTSGLDADADFGVNANPTLDAIGNLSVNEGTLIGFIAAGHDSAGDSASYSLVGDSHGATLDASTGAFSWTALDGDASAGFTLRITDSAGGTADQDFTVTVHNVAPTLSLSGAASVTDDQDFVLDLASSDPGQDTLSGWTVHWGDGSSSQLNAAAGALSHRYAAPGSYTVQTTATDEDGSYNASTTVTVQAGTLKVTDFAATATGFQVRFNRAFAPGEINLYDSSFYNRGAADLVFQDGNGRNVAGSAVLDSDFQGLRFVKTNGLLANSSYTIRLDSRIDAFKDSLGGLLDGNRDGVAGGNFSGAFTVNGSGAVLSLGEFSRGPGQAADVPATAAGVPITITGAAGARQVAFTLAYDPSLLNITGVAGGTGMPGGSTVSADFSTPGQVRISLQLGAALGAGSVDLVKLVAQVPGSAPYGAKQVLDLRNILLDTGAAVRDDDGLHLVAYVGDASGNAKYSTLDVQRIQRTVVHLDNGFGAYPLVDPTVVADINGNRALTSLDAQRVLSEVMGLDRAEIPPIPKGMTLTFSGPDPVVSAASVSAAAGDTVVVPISLDTAAGLESVEITLAYPADSLELLDVRLGGLTQDFHYFVKDTSVAGRIVIDMARMQAMAGGAGTLVELEFRVKAGATGSLAIDLLSTALNETRLTLNAESVAGIDPTDGMVTVPAPAALAVAPVAPVDSPAPAAAAVDNSTPVPPPAVVAPLTTAPVQAVLPVVAGSVADLVPDFVLPPASVPSVNLPTFSVQAPVVEPLPPVINFNASATDFDLGQARANNWVRDWVSPARDKAAALKLNHWKVGLPAASGKAGAR